MEYTSICGALSRNTARTRREKSAYRVMLPENTVMLCTCTRCRILKSGSPIFMPSALASLLRAMAQPSLFESTMTGRVGRVPFKGKLAETVYQLVGGIRAGMGYCGAKDIETLQNARFVRITASGVTENHPHDITITSETPNYSRGE